MNRGTILLRVDGSASLGMGKMARCLALANALQRRRYQMTFVSQIDNNAWPERIRRFRHNVAKTPHPAGSAADRSDFLRDVASKNPVVVITDSPNINADYLAALSNQAPLVVALDESAGIRFTCDMVLNPTMGRGREDYDLAPGTQLLAGNKYAMIRAEFRRARNVRATEPGGPTRVLLALGCGDVAASTLAYAKALLKTSVIEKVDAVLGAGKSGRDALEAFAAEHSDRISVAADVRDLGPRMTKAHLLITGGGNTALEAACVGVPMLLISRQKQHEMNATWLEELGVAQHLGRSEKVAPQQVAQAAVAVLEDNFERKAMSRSGRMLIDGRGADRIVTATEILMRQRQSRKVKALAA